MSNNELPAKWAASRLGELVTVIRGVSYEKSEAKHAPEQGHVPILRANNIQQGLVFDDLVYVPSKRVSEDQQLKEGDIVIAASSGSKHIVGKAAHLKEAWRGSFGAFCLGLRPASELQSRYIALFLESKEYRNKVSALSAGVNINNLRRNHIEELPIRVSPLGEQGRIVAKVEELFSDLDAGVATLERVRANLKRYRAAVLKAAVEGKLTEQWRKEHPYVEPGNKLLERILVERKNKWEEVQITKYVSAGRPPPKGWKDNYRVPVSPVSTSFARLPKGWCWATTDQLFSYVTSGSRGWAAYYSESGPLFLRIANLDHGRIDLDLGRLQHVTPPLGSEGERTRVCIHDLLISITADVGMVGYVRKDIGESYINQHIALARGAVAETIEYLAWFLTAEVGQSQFKKLQRGATKVGLGLDDIRAVVVPLPPLAEQREIVAHIDEAYSAASWADTTTQLAIGRSRQLRQAILKRAFEGKLVPQDPNDEPASVLLERIRAERAAEKAVPRAHKRRKSAA